MGRIKTMLIKRTAIKLYTNHRHSFKKDFTENKKAVGRHAEIDSKKLRNAVAGYITRLMGQEGVKKERKSTKSYSL